MEPYGVFYHRFKTDWDKTSSHKMRSGTDMQYAFSYYYFLMDSKMNNTEVDFIREMDIDNSRYLLTTSPLFRCIDVTAKLPGYIHVSYPVK